MTSAEEYVHDLDGKTGRIPEAVHPEPQGPHLDHGRRRWRLCHLCRYLPQMQYMVCVIWCWYSSVLTEQQ